MKGTLEQAGQRWRLRFTRDLDHPVPQVWRAVTEPAHLETWFPFRITGDWAVGSHLTFSDPQSRVPDFTGEVLAFQPPALLEFRWGPDILRLEVAGRDTGCTLTLLHTFGEHGKAARDAAGLARVPGSTGPPPGRQRRAAGQPVGAGPPGLRELFRPGSLERRGAARIRARERADPPGSSVRPGPQRAGPGRV